jgi:hypothetical protein
MQSLKQMHLESLNLTLDSQPSKGDKWEKICSAQEDVKMIKMSREFPKSRPPTIYKCPPENIDVRLFTVPALGQPDTPVWSTRCSPSIRSIRAKPMDGCHVSLFEYHSLISNGNKTFNVQSTSWPDAPLYHTWHGATQSLFISREGSPCEKHDRTCPVASDLTLPVSSRCTDQPLRTLLTSSLHLTMNSDSPTSDLHRLLATSNPVSHRNSSSSVSLHAIANTDRTLTSASGHCVTSVRSVFLDLCSNVLTTEYITLCTCVSIFSQIFFKGYVSTLDS